MKTHLTLDVLRQTGGLQGLHSLVVGREQRERLPGPARGECTYSGLQMD